MEAAASSIAAVIERFNDLGFANVVFSSGAFPTTLQNICLLYTSDAADE